MKEQHIPVGIYNKEIFIVRLVDGKLYRGIDNKPVFDVIRPVEDSTLDYLRNQSEREDEYKDFWKQAVAADATEESFQDWYDSLWEEEFDEDDPEDFHGKDDSDCQYLDEEKRLAADNFLYSEYGMRVGTWESSGGYPPAFRNEPFEGWDYVFNDPLSEKFAKEYEDSEK
jgi:hypothetical protein